MSGVDTLLSMRVFRQVVESSSFVRAAERLELSAAMTSKHVSQLEKHLGTRLLDRSSRSLNLTVPGKLFYARCKLILEMMEEADREVGSLHDAPRGTLRVTCPSWASGRRMADLLAAYRRRYPEVVVDISFEDRLVDIIEEGYDLALRATLGQPPAGLIARPLRPMPFVIAASAEYLQRCGVPKVPEDLAHHDSIVVGDGQSWQLLGSKGRIEVPARAVLRFRTLTVGVAHAVCAGIGLAPLPRAMLEDPVFRDAVRPVLSDYALRLPHLYAIYVSRRQVPPKIRTFIDHVIEYLAQVGLQEAES
jgi:DNA-binding transcriptional LysR family regulator